MVTFNIYIYTTFVVISFHYFFQIRLLRTRIIFPGRKDYYFIHSRVEENCVLLETSGYWDDSVCLEREAIQAEKDGHPGLVYNYHWKCTISIIQLTFNLLIMIFKPLQTANSASGQVPSCLPLSQYVSKF